MSSFIITPTNVDLLESIFRDPITGKWYIPVLTFNTSYLSPFYREADPLNEDPRYQDRVIDHFWLKLTERWLYRDPSFRSLLKYFHVERDDERGTVSLVSDPGQAKKDVSDINEENKMYIFKYIEKFFITRKFVEKTLRKYVDRTGIKWYDLYVNSDVIKDLLRHKLKKLIISTIYELQERGANKKAVD